MELLSILFTLLIILSGIGIVLLYASKNPQTKKLSFYYLTILSIIITFLNVTSLPSNYISQIVIAFLIEGIALVAWGIKVKNPQKDFLYNLLITASVLCGLIYLFFFVG